MNEKRTRADFRRRDPALQLGFMNPRPYRAVCRDEKGETAR